MGRELCHFSVSVVTCWSCDRDGLSVVVTTIISLSRPPPAPHPVQAPAVHCGNSGGVARAPWQGLGGVARARIRHMAA
jgi:hypothetical protein